MPTGTIPPLGVTESGQSSPVMVATVNDQERLAAWLASNVAAAERTLR